MFENHFALSAKNKGCALRCCGKVVLRFFLVDDCESKWDTVSSNNFKSVVSDASDILTRAARRDYLCLEVVPAFAHKQLQPGVRATGEDVSWVRGLYSSVQQLVSDQEHFRGESGCDESPVIFALNKNFRSCARSTKSGSEGNRGDEEWSVLGIRNARSVDTRTLLHEILHQFGAVDLYYPEKVRLAAERHLGQSVMGFGSGMEIDDLTKVLIGWRRTFSEGVQRFLSETAAITMAEIQDAVREEWKKEWNG